MIGKYKIHLYVYFAVCFFFMSCSRYGRRVEEALSFSGENRHELELVLKHYQDSTSKLEAAKFLISNMMGIYTPDIASLVEMQSFYQICESVKLQYKATQRERWAVLIDSLWDVYQKDKMPEKKYTPLLKTVTAEQLIAEIELAFCSWKENVFTKDCSFDDFCEYILPLYRGNSFVLDDTRLRFYQLYKGQFYTDEKKNIFAETDSLLSYYKNIEFDTFYGSNIPILSAGALMQVSGGRCPERGTFNSLLFSALGIPIAMDFVPAWGNRNGSHSWNVLLIKNKCYAFDPFWNRYNWVFTQLYSNTGIYDPNGLREFRTPKIYRKTYSTHLETTLLDKGVSIRDIPPLFLNFKKKDVSAEYFEAVDAKVKLTEMSPEDTQYAYLCVFDLKGWVPVQFAKIVHKEAVFKDMGKNIVYLPAYYKNGQVLPAAMPFLLDAEGEVRSLNISEDLRDSIIVRNIVPEAWKNRDYLNCMVGTSVIGWNKGGGEDTLCQISALLPIKRTTHKVNTNSCYRFLRLNLPSDSIALGELSFYTSKDKIEKVKITSALQSLDRNCTPELLFDNSMSTCYRGKTKTGFVEVDLGKEYLITSIVVVPFVMSQIFRNSSYELFYWENEWKSLDIQEGGKSCLIFKNVPRNALLRLKQSTKVDRKIDERIFIYKDGEVIWM